MIKQETIDSVRKEIGRNFRKQRIRSGMTGVELSRMCGLGGSYVCRIEKGITNYNINSFILLIGAMKEKQNDYNNLKTMYRGIGKFGMIRKCQVINRIVGSHFHIAPILLKCESRTKPYVQARYYSYTLMTEFTHANPGDIARMYNRHRTTVIAGLGEFQNWLETRDKLAQDYPIVFNKVEKAFKNE